MFCGANIAIFHKNGRFLTFRNKIIIFVVQSYLWLADIFLMKVYSLLSLNGNLVNFNYNKESNTLIAVYWCIGTLVAYTNQYWCGVLFICCKGFTRTSIQIDELAPHFLYFY